jgi:hypothetical protein
MAAGEDNPRRQSIGEEAGQEFASQDFGDDPVGGMHAAGVNRKKAAQGSAGGDCKKLDALDELRMLN